MIAFVVVVVVVVFCFFCEEGVEIFMCIHRRTGCTIYFSLKSCRHIYF